MFRKRKQTAGEDKPVADTVASTSDGVTGPATDATALPRVTESILDALGSIVRGFGKYGFRVEDVGADEVADLFDHWARHALIGAPPPKADPDTEVQNYPLDQRRWQELRVSLLRHRRAEKEFVDKSLLDLKGIVFESLGILRHISGENGDLDRGVSLEMNALHQTLQGESIAKIRAQAERMIDAVSTSMATRRDRHQEHMQKMGKKIQGIERELLEAKEELSVDALTGLGNRRAFDLTLERLVNVATFTASPFAILLFDLDRFKDVNDTHGHDFGDTALKTVGSAICRSFPRKDDFAARFGGDEFAVLLPGTDAELSGKLARRFLENVAPRTMPTPDGPLTLSCTIGLAVFDANPPLSAEELFRHADQALYRAKAKQRGTCATWPLED
ncbi:MAG: GGDEF domain-containing protein [Kiritimatiellia bacterium]|nr:GGDEF domain-containing protein [Kiritimatiellia bacterium]MDP6631270.1 GGDEF domain-containing protein [Kiritimatiellia bacterium]MDP6809601.1 GGDEF domain-containing protein [Kiritimatiellia bacterium]MDP7023548.1 GGDEF domain-containing protein [Kiritimatiellia bacterium]